MKGIVEWFEPKKGYGFAKSQDGKEVYIHHTSFQGLSETKAGEEIEFDIVPGEKGLKASQIRKKW